MATVRCRMFKWEREREREREIAQPSASAWRNWYSAFQAPDSWARAKSCDVQQIFNWVTDWWEGKTIKRDEKCFFTILFCDVQQTGKLTVTWNGASTSMEAGCDWVERGGWGGVILFCLRWALPSKIFWDWIGLDRLPLNRLQLDAIQLDAIQLDGPHLDTIHLAATRRLP